MSIQISDVRWGSYSDYEGPWHPGVAKWTPTTFPTDGHKLLDVVTQTEGASPSAANFYDKCTVSIGLLQWCEQNYHLSSNLLGYIAQKDPSLLDPMRGRMQKIGAEFRRTPNGLWRFYLNGLEVTAGAKQKELWLGGASGLQKAKKGEEWTAARKQYAKEWVKALVNTLHQPEAIELQIEFTAQRMYNFAMPESRTILFSEGKPLAGWPGAVQAAFLSYAANLPAVANRHLKIAVERSTAAKWSEAWCLDVIKELAFGPGISIYPHRYDKIRPRLEFHFGVDLPDCSDELKAWRSSQGGDSRFETVEEIQQFLLSQGHDLGPWGADGVLGKATVAAIQEFQKRHGLVADGIVGRQTRAKMATVGGKKS